MIKTKIVIKTKYRLSENQKETVKSNLETFLDKNLIIDFFIEEKTDLVSQSNKEELKKILRAEVE